MSSNTLKISTIGLFAGTLPGANVRFEELAHEFGLIIGKKHLSLIFGGGSTGLMGAAAKACLNSGGKVIGVIPDSMMDRDDTFTEASDLIIVSNMHLRKQKLYELSDILLAFPGGLGTLEETIEALSWLNLGIHSKVLILFNIDGYWDPLISLLEHMIRNNLMDKDVLNKIEVIHDIKQINSYIENIHSNSSFNSNTKPLNSFRITLDEKDLNPVDRALMIQEDAANKGFDWLNELDALKKVKEELEELEIELGNTRKDRVAIEDEYGDLLLSILNLSRHLKLDYEKIITVACDKFTKRFANMENLVCLSGKNISSLPLEEALVFWKEAKQRTHTSE